MSAAVSAPVDSKRASFGTASFVFAALAVFLPVAIGFLTGYQVDRDHEAGRDGLAGLGTVVAGVFGAVVAAGASSVAGAASGVVALVRGEPSVWRPVIGLIVNTPIVLFVLYLVAVALNR